MSDGEIVSLDTKRKFSDRQRSMLFPCSCEAAPVTFDSRRSPVQACLLYLRERLRRKTIHARWSISFVFVSHANGRFRLAGERVLRIDSFQDERAFLIKLEHPPLRNYEVSLIVPARYFLDSVPTPIVSGTGPFRLSLCRSISDNDSPRSFIHDANTRLVSKKSI